MISDTLVLTSSRRQPSIALALCGGLIALGLWIIRLGDETDMVGESLIGVVVLSVISVLLLVRLARPPRLLLTPEGFTLTGLPNASAPWREVERFVVYSSPADADGQGEVAPCAAWRLREGFESRSGLVAALHRLASSPIDGALPNSFRMKPEALVALMEDWRQRHSPVADSYQARL